MFPDEENQTLINAYRSNGLKSNSAINNPYYQQQNFAFHGMAPIIERGFGDLLMEAITKKINKKHPNKNEVILIIDNRTIHYELEDILTSLSNYSSQLSDLPFKEVVIYTGYYSDITGIDAVYSFIIIKTTDVYHGLTS